MEKKEKEKENIKNIEKSKDVDLKELIGFLEGRDIFRTEDVLNGIKINTHRGNLKEVASLLLSNKKLIENSTILRGGSFSNTGELGQSLVRGSIEKPLVQVVVSKGSYEIKGMFPLVQEFIPLEKREEEIFNETTLHELLHSFTSYIVSTYVLQEENRLKDYEKTFYENIVSLHNKFLEKHKTGEKYLDNINEYIVKSLTVDLNNGIFDIANYNLVFSEFKKFYLQNEKQIKSFSMEVDEMNNRYLV